MGLDKQEANGVLWQTDRSTLDVPLGYSGLSLTSLAKALSHSSAALPEPLGPHK